jgi:RNA ligase (TIGR02306 family)
MTDRKLATIRKIDNIFPIPNADAIDLAVLGGWQVVVKKGEFQPGSLVVYFEIDSWIPYNLAPFLSKGKPPKVYNGVQGERLRSIKLRGQLSQGLVLPIEGTVTKIDNAIFEGLDVTDNLGIQKWEAPIHPSLAGQVKGNFPLFIPKTNEERIQNLDRSLEQWIQEDDLWEVTEKLDGSSMTVYFKDDVYGVCSRNYDLDLDQEGNTFITTAAAYGLQDKLEKFGANIAVQGELIGSNIQGNPYKLDNGTYKYMVYKIWDIDNKVYLNDQDRIHFCDLHSLDYVPVISDNFKLKDYPTIGELLKLADGASDLNGNTKREGLVFKNSAGESFKAISNEWLLSNNE